MTDKSLKAHLTPRTLVGPINLYVQCMLLKRFFTLLRNQFHLILTQHITVCFIFRGCKTGEGHFQFLTQQGREILECVKLQTQKLASMRHLPHDRPRRPSLDSVPCTRSSENETVDSLTSNSFS